MRRCSSRIITLPSQQQQQGGRLCFPRPRDFQHPALFSLPVLQTNHSSRLLLFQVAHKIPERTTLDLSPICDWHLAAAGGQGKENCMACGAADPLADVVQLGLVQPQPLGDFQVRLVLLVPHQLFNHLHFPLCEEEFCGEEGVFEDEPSLPRFVNPLCQVRDRLCPAQPVSSHPIFRAVGRPGVHLPHPAGRSIQILSRPLAPIIMTTSSSKTTSSMVRSMVVVAMEATTTTMAIHSSSPM